MCVWLAMIEDKTFPSRSTTAAAVSSHEDSIPKIRSLLIQIPKHFRFRHHAEAFDHRRIHPAIHQCRRRSPQGTAVNREIGRAVELGEYVFDVVRCFRAVRVRAGDEQWTGLA